MANQSDSPSSTRPRGRALAVVLVGIAFVCILFIGAATYVVYMLLSLVPDQQGAPLAQPVPAPGNPKPEIRPLEPEPFVQLGPPPRLANPYDTNWRRESVDDERELLFREARKAVEDLQKDQVDIDGTGHTVYLNLLHISLQDKIETIVLQNLRRAGVVVLRVSSSGDPNEVGLSDAGLSELRGLRCLEDLDLSGPKITDAGLAALKDLRSLKKLCFNERGRKQALTGEGFQHLEGLRGLEKITVENGSVNDAGLAGISRATSVSDLNLSRNKFTDAGLPHLAALTNLRVLNLASNKINGTGLQGLAKLEHLTSIILDDSTITEEGCSAIATVPLRGISLRASKITDGGVAKFSRMSSLVGLVLDSCPITDEGVLSLGNLRLENLSLGYTKVTDASTKTLANMLSLKSLLLHNCAISDVGLKAISSLPNLEHLVISETQITDAGLQELAKCPKLWFLQVSKTPTITDEGIEKLKARAPELRVRSD